MYALIGNFDFTEVIVIAAAALMLFGRRLPEVAMRAATQFMRARRAVSKMWREAGLEDELRRVKREVEQLDVPKFQAPHKMVKDATRRYMRDLEHEIDSDVGAGGAIPPGAGDPSPPGADGSIPPSADQLKPPGVDGGGAPTSAGQRPNPALEAARAHASSYPGAPSYPDGPGGPGEPGDRAHSGPDPEPSPPATGAGPPPEYAPRPVPPEALTVDDRREESTPAPPDEAPSDDPAHPSTDDRESA